MLKARPRAPVPVPPWGGRSQAATRRDPSGGAPHQAARRRPGDHESKQTSAAMVFRPFPQQGVDPASLPAAGRPTKRESINDNALATSMHAPRRVSTWTSTSTHGLHMGGEVRVMPVYREYLKPEYPLGQYSTRDIDGANAGTVPHLTPLSRRGTNPLVPAYTLPDLLPPKSQDAAGLRAPRDPLRIDDIPGTKAEYVDRLNPPTKDIPRARATRKLERDPREAFNRGKLGLWTYGDSGMLSRSRRHEQTPSNPLEPVYRYDERVQAYEADCAAAAAARRAAVPARATLSASGGGPDGEVQGTMERLRASVAGPYGAGRASRVLEGKLVLDPVRRTGRYGRGGVKHVHTTRAASVTSATAAA